MADETIRQLSAQNEILNAAMNLLLAMIEKTDRDYARESEAFVEQWAGKGLMSYRIPDETFDMTVTKLKDAGISYLAFDNATTTDHVIFFPKPFTQHVESIAMATAKETDRLSQVSKDEINDLCYFSLMKGKEPARYELTVPDELCANRMRETLTKKNQLKTVFSMDRNADGTITFTCPVQDCEKLNKAYFETAWNFAGRFAAINRKQEQYDLERQLQLEDRMKEDGNYYIVDPEIDEKGNPTGKIKEMIRIDGDTISFYKNGKDVAESVRKDMSEEYLDTFQSWTDRLSRPIIIEESEWPEKEKYIRERNPKVFLEQSDHDRFKADLSDMFKTEKKMARVFREPFNQRSMQALVGYLEAVDTQKDIRMGREYIPKADEIRKFLEKADPKEEVITEKDLDSLDRVIAIAKEEAKEAGMQARQQEREVIKNVR